MSSKPSCTKEALVEDIDIPPSSMARQHRAMPAPTPARLSVDEVFEISESPPDPIPTADQDHDSIPDPKDDNELALKNDIRTYTGGAATELSSSSTANDTRISIQQAFGKVNIERDSTSYIGNVFNHYYSPALFGGLQALTSDVTDDAAIRYRQSRASNQVSEEIGKSNQWLNGCAVCPDDAHSLSATRLSKPTRGQNGLNQNRCRLPVS
jgi:hypothetical protein